MKGLKRFKTIMLAGLMAAAAALTFTGCAEYSGEQHRGATAHSWNNGTIVEATVVLDGMKAVKVFFDEIFGLADAGVATGAVTDTVTVGTKTYAKYVGVGNKYFECEAVENKAVYKLLPEKTTTFEQFAQSDAGREEYIKSINEKAAKYYNTDASLEGNTVGDLKLKAAGNLTTTYKGMRKRYSTYWTVGGAGYVGDTYLGWQGNMDQLELYFIQNGFDGVSDEGKITGTTGTSATLDDASPYIKTAKAAYNAAIKL